MNSSLLLILFGHMILVRAFVPNNQDYDAFGLKLAANDVLFVQADVWMQMFIVQYAPYNYTFSALECFIPYDDPTHYVYSIGVGWKQNSTSNTYFFFSGEVSSLNGLSVDSKGHSGTFIGVWMNRDPRGVLFYSTNQQFLPCDMFNLTYLEFLSSYGHQEYFVMAVEPYGQYALGLASGFVFRYQPFAIPVMITRNGTAVWPNNTIFYPCAADASETFTVVSGLLTSLSNSRARSIPVVYLLLNSNLTVTSSWSYTAPSDSWQSRLKYDNLPAWSSEYAMSVKINMGDGSRVLVGMPFLNTVFMFVVNSRSMTIQIVSSTDNGDSVGYGKSVSWLTPTQAAILIAPYTSSSGSQPPSKVYLYTSANSTELPASPTAVIPNLQQPLPLTINAQWIRIVSTPSSIVVLDVNGWIFVVLAEPPGMYASTATTPETNSVTIALISQPAMCMGGTYKADTAVYPCSLCPQGSKNPGGVLTLVCSRCSADSFCPLGALYEMSATALVLRSQTVAYPRTPDMDVFEDILLHNMFSLGPTGHCLAVSPIFWTLILLFIVAVFLAGMASLKFCVQPEKREQWRMKVKYLFRKTDLVVRRSILSHHLSSL